MTPDQLRAGAIRMRVLATNMNALEHNQVLSPKLRYIATVLKDDANEMAERLEDEAISKEMSTK